MSDHRLMSQYQSLVIILIFSKQFLRLHQSGAHGTCHACYTLDTPLQTHEASQTIYTTCYCVVRQERFKPVFLNLFKTRTIFGPV